jgi:hypothetical protein
MNITAKEITRFSACASPPFYEERWEIGRSRDQVDFSGIQGAEINRVKLKCKT